MSGESVVTTSLPSVSISATGRAAARATGSAAWAAGRATGATVSVAGAAARGVKRRIDEQIALAEERAAEEHRQLAAWRDEQVQQAEQMQAWHDQLTRFWQTSGQWQDLDQKQTPAAPKREAGRARGYLEEVGNGGEDRSRAEALLAGIHKFIDALPEQLQRDPQAPFARLREQLQRQQNGLRDGQTPSPASLETFRQMVSRTVAQYHDKLDRERASRAQLAERAQALSDEAALMQQLSPRHKGWVGAIQTRLRESLKNGELSPGAIEAIQAELDAIRPAIEQAMALDALRPELACAATEELGELGYAQQAGFLRDFGPHDQSAALRTPGGARLNVTVTGAGQLVFEIGAAGNAAGLSAADVALVREEEARWCRDLQTLTSRLAGRGFACEVSLERLISEQKLPVARMETPADWDKKAEDKSRERRRRQTGKQRGFKQ